MLVKTYWGYRYYIPPYESDIPSEDFLRERIRDEIALINKDEMRFSFRKFGCETDLSEKEFRRWLNGEVSIRYSSLKKILDYLSTFS